MENIINVTYETTGQTTAVNEMGMRPMQARAYNARNSQYILLKAPPASGKSRALMFIALDKLKTGAVKKVIVAVPERSIGKSFLSTELVKYGFHSDWEVSEKYNLCVPGGENSKVETFKATPHKCQNPHYTVGAKLKLWIISEFMSTKAH